MMMIGISIVNKYWLSIAYPCILLLKPTMVDIIIIFNFVLKREKKSSFNIVHCVRVKSTKCYEANDQRLIKRWVTINTQPDTTYAVRNLAT